MTPQTRYAGTPQRGTYSSGKESYLGIRPPSTYGSSPHPGEPRIPYSDAASFYGGSAQDRKRGERLEEELLLSLALYGFGGMEPHPRQKYEDEEDDCKPRRSRPYDAHRQQDVSASYRSNASVATRAKEGGLEKKAKDRKNTAASRSSASLSYQL